MSSSRLEFTFPAVAGKLEAINLFTIVPDMTGTGTKEPTYPECLLEIKRLPYPPVATEPSPQKPHLPTFKPVSTLFLAQDANIGFSSKQIGPAALPPNIIFTGSALASHLGFLFVPHMTPVVLASLTLNVYQNSKLVFHTTPNRDFAGRNVPPLPENEKEAAYIFLLDDDAIAGAGKFLAKDSSVSVSIDLEKPVPAPQLFGMCGGDLVRFAERPTDTQYHL